MKSVMSLALRHMDSSPPPAEQTKSTVFDYTGGKDQRSDSSTSSMSSMSASSIYDRGSSVTSNPMSGGDDRAFKLTRASHKRAI